MRAAIFYSIIPLVIYIGLYSPIWGLIIYLSVNIIRPEMIFWGANTGSIIFKISMISTIVGFILNSKSDKYSFNCGEFWLIVWIWIAVMASISLSSYPVNPRSWYYSFEFLKLCILSWLIIGLIKSDVDIYRVVNSLLFIATILSMWGWDQSFRGNDRLEGLGGNSFGDSNGVAAFGVLFLLIGFSRMIGYRTTRQKLLGLISFIIIAGMIVFTQSRGGFVGLLAGIVYFILISPKKKYAILLILISVIVISPLISRKYIERLDTITAGQEERDLSAGSRLVLWHAGWLIFLDNPIFGCGLLNFRHAKLPYKEELSGSYSDDLLDFAFKGYKVGHSTWFCQILSEGGLFLAVPYFMLILLFFLKSYKARKIVHNIEEYNNLNYTLIGVEAGIAGYCVSISFVDALISPFLPVQILIGMQIIKNINSNFKFSK